MFTIAVDGDRCQGHARCLAFAPDVFDFDDEGYAFVPDDKRSYETLPNDVMQAIGNCPERAIAVNEDAAP